MSWQTTCCTITQTPQSGTSVPRLLSNCLEWWIRPQVDLFTSHLNHQPLCWFGQTDHPLVAASDALLQTMDRVVTVCLSPNPSSREDTDNDQRDQQRRSSASPLDGQGDPGTMYSSRWHARSPSCFHAEWISCHNAYLARVCFTMLT